MTVSLNIFYCCSDTYSVAAFSKRKLNVRVKGLTIRKHIETLSSPYTIPAVIAITACSRSAPFTLFDQVGKLVSAQSRIVACKIVPKVKQLPNIAESSQWFTHISFNISFSSSASSSSLGDRGNHIPFKIDSVWCIKFELTRKWLQSCQNTINSLLETSCTVLQAYHLR